MIQKYEEKTTPFKRWNSKVRVITPEPKASSLKIKRAGKELSLQEFLNENNHDCTIYQVLQTYRGDMKLTQARLNTITRNVADNLQEVDGLRDALAIMNKAKETWNDLPLEVRKEFKNDVYEFQRNGLKWANSKIKEFEKIQKAEQDKFKQNTETGDK